MMKKNINQNTNPILKKNQETWLYSGKTLIQVIGTTIFVTTGINQAGLICLMSKDLLIYSRKMNSVKIRLILAHTIQSIFDILGDIIRNAILIINKLFGKAGKKLIFTGWRNSFFTSWGK